MPADGMFCESSCPRNASVWAPKLICRKVSLFRKLFNRFLIYMMDKPETQMI